MEYYFFADLHDCNVSHYKMCEYFQDGIEDVGIDSDWCTLYKINGDLSSLTNPTSKDIKKTLFNSSKGHIYKFKTENEISDTKLQLLKSTLVMKIMGNLEIKPTFFMNDDESTIKYFKMYIKRHKSIEKDIEKRYPQILSADCLQDISGREMFSKIKPNSRVAYYSDYKKIEIYMNIKKAIHKLQEILCNIT